MVKLDEAAVSEASEPTAVNEVSRPTAVSEAARPRVYSWQDLNDSEDDDEAYASDAPAVSDMPAEAAGRPCKRCQRPLERGCTKADTEGLVCDGGCGH
eukprot:748805-Prymnesium_polylepis.1